MAADLYATLGVDKDADHAAIRRAYKQRAKKVHPDTGGSSKEFVLVKLAHDVLTDDQRRAKYDQTGDFEESVVDNLQPQAMNVLANALNMVLAKLYEETRPPIHNDMVALTRAAVRDMRKGPSGQMVELEKHLIITKELLGRWADKSGNAMEKLTLNRAKLIEAQIASIKPNLEAMDRALAILNDTSFRFDQVPPPVAIPQWAGGSFTKVSLGNIWGT